MSPRPDVSEERKQQISEAATTVFSRLGFHKARIDDIAAEAGLSKGTLYLYFKNKDAIITSLLANLFERELSDLQSLKDDPRPAADRILSFVDLTTDDILKWQRFIPIMYEFLSRISRQSIVQKAFKTYLNSYMALIIPIIQQGIDSGEFKAVDAHEIAVTLGAIIEGTILLWVFDSELVNLERHVSSGVQLLLEG
ncbi:MAG: TetR/AcrR family transcriptional regulator, partial [Chloroflexota bacterium]